MENVELKSVRDPRLAGLGRPRGWTKRGGKSYRELHQALLAQKEQNAPNKKAEQNQVVTHAALNVNKQSDEIDKNDLFMTLAENEYYIRINDETTLRVKGKLEISHANQISA